MSTIEELRYQYSLDENDAVIDCGFYKGDFSIKIKEMYGCHVEAYEPVKKLYDEGLEKIKHFPPRFGFPGIKLIHAAVCDDIKMDGWTYLFPTPNGSEDVKFIAMRSVIRNCPIDLLNLDVKGMEFEILEGFLKYGYQKHMKNIQVKFHPVVPDCEVRHKKIREGLTKTHRLTYDLPWISENYERIDS